MEESEARLGAEDKHLVGGCPAHLQCLLSPKSFKVKTRTHMASQAGRMQPVCVHTGYAAAENAVKPCGTSRTYSMRAGRKAPSRAAPGRQPLRLPSTLGKCPNKKLEHMILAINSGTFHLTTDKETGPPNSWKRVLGNDFLTGTSGPRSHATKVKKAFLVFHAGHENRLLSSGSLQIRPRTSPADRGLVP